MFLDISYLYVSTAKLQKQTVYFIAFIEEVNVDSFRRLPPIPLVYTLKIKPSCQGLPNALEISRMVTLIVMGG